MILCPLATSHSKAWVSPGLLQASVVVCPTVLRQGGEDGGGDFHGMTEARKGLNTRLARGVGGDPGTVEEGAGDVGGATD